MTIQGYTCSLAGGERFEFASLCEALTAVRSLWPTAYFHGDGSRVLAWSTEAESENDDGRRAVAAIRPTMMTAAERYRSYADHIGGAS
jgi:hypothetical protein